MIATQKPGCPIFGAVSSRLRWAVRAACPVSAYRLHGPFTDRHHRPQPAQHPRHPIQTLRRPRLARRLPLRLSREIRRAAPASHGQPRSQRARRHAPLVPVAHLSQPPLAHHRPLSRTPRHRRQHLLRSRPAAQPTSTPIQRPTATAAGTPVRPSGCSPSSRACAPPASSGPAPRPRSRASAPATTLNMTTSWTTPSASTRSPPGSLSRRTCAPTSSRSTTRTSTTPATAYGPDSDEVRAAVHHLDDMIGLLQEKLAATKLPVDLIVVSDHGMVDAQARSRHALRLRQPKRLPHRGLSALRRRPGRRRGRRCAVRPVQGSPRPALLRLPPR